MNRPQGSIAVVGRATDGVGQVFLVDLNLACGEDGLDGFLWDGFVFVGLEFRVLWFFGFFAFFPFRFGFVGFFLLMGFLRCGLDRARAGPPPRPRRASRVTRCSSLEPAVSSWSSLDSL